jgi:WD repeat-containing protein 35
LLHAGNRVNKYNLIFHDRHHTVIFWDTRKNTTILKYVKNLLDVTSAGSFFLITAKISESNYILILCNSIGSPIDNRVINIAPNLITMNETHVIISNKFYVYVWQYRSQSSLSDSSNNYVQFLNIDLLKKKMMREIAFFIDDNPNLNDYYNIDTFQPNKTTGDKIISLYSNSSFMVACCESGRILKYQFPNISTPDRIAIGVKCIKIGLSLNGDTIWGIDENNILSLWEIEKSNAKRLKAIKMDFEKKDVWDVFWSREENNNFAILEKNRLHIIRGTQEEEILQCNGYIADFTMLDVTTIMLEDLMNKPWETNMNPSDIIVKFETRIIRDLREMLKNKINMNEIFQFVEKNSNRKLWELFAENALLQLDFINAEKAMLQYNDYLGLSFLKRVKAIDDDLLKKAEIHQFFLEYDKAEEIYTTADRKDLIITMRMKLGHWDKVINLINKSGYLQEDNMKTTYNNLGMQLFESKDYKKAEEIFQQTNNYEALINLWFKTEEFEKAYKAINMISEDSEFLFTMGEKFESVNNFHF